MMKFFLAHHPAIYFISLFALLFTVADLRADDESASLSTSVAEETKGFLSDPARSGGLVGSIIAGAALANPLAPLLGSIAGYLVGKETDYTNSNQARQNGYARPSLIPENDNQVATLSGLTDTPLQQTGQLSVLESLKNPGSGEENEQQQAEQPNTLKLAKGLGVGQQPQNGQSIQLGLPPGAASKGNLQQQIAFACNHVKVTQRLPVLCYYYSQ